MERVGRVVRSAAGLTVTPTTDPTGGGPSAKHHFPATISIPIAKTPTKTAMETPAYNMLFISATVIMVFSSSRYLVPLLYACAMPPKLHFSCQYNLLIKCILLIQNEF